MFRNMLWLRILAITVLLILAVSACQQEVQVEVTRVVTEKETVVETVVETVLETVTETVVVEGTPQVMEQEVTRVVEVEKVITATPEPPAEEQRAEIKNPNTFTMLHKADIISLDPGWYFDGASMQAVVKMYEKLIVFKGESVTEFEPLLATDIPSEENGLVRTEDDGSVTYVFPIREGVKFHNGDIVTPEDVKYSLLRFLLMDRSGGGAYVLMPALTGGYSHIEDLAVNLAGVESFDQVGADGLQATFDVLDHAITVQDNTVEFHLPEPYAPFLSVLAGSWPDRIVDKAWVIEQGGWPGTAETWVDYHDPAAGDTVMYEQANGTGPFKLVNWDRTNKEITLERFDDYWGGPVALEKVIIRHVPEWATRKLILEAGDADWVDADFAVLSQLEGMQGVRIIGGLPTLYDRVLHFHWNVAGENNPAIGSGQLDGQGIPPDFFSDINVRKGFAYAYDYDTYIKDVWEGQARQSKGPVLVGQLGYRAAQPEYTFDPMQAEEHFRNAYDGQLWEMGFEFTAYTPDRYGETGKAALDILAEGLLSINPKFKMNIETVQWSTFLGNVFGEQNMPLFVLNMGADYADTDNVVSLYMASDYFMVPYQGESFIALAEQEFDPLIKQARTSLNEAERESTYDKLQRMAFDYAINIYLEQGIEEHVIRDWVQGLGWNANGERHWSLVGVSKGY
jgi:peptide/nickel transport system substrate-binding protein